MKVYHPSEKLTSLKTQILQLQLTLELSQIQEILSAYSDLLLFFAEYSFLFINDSTETPVLNDKHSNFEGCFITQDPARDGSNWYGYCGQNPVVDNNSSKRNLYLV